MSSTLCRLDTDLPWTSPAAHAYAGIRFSLTRAAGVIGELDMMIAAQAIASDPILLSNYVGHFFRLIPPLRLENWTE